ncbi:MAG TPA: APC family permease [Wenzhouxiangella sp.]
MNTQTEGHLKQSVGLWGVISLGFGTAVGVSIFSVLSPAVASAGPAVLWVLPITMVPMLIFALVYAVMGSADPVSGASFEWPRRYVHPLLAFMLSWTRITGTASALIVLTYVLVSYWQMVFDIPTKLSMFLVFLAVFLVNRAGIRSVARGQGGMVALLLLTFLVLIVLSLPRVEPNQFVPWLPNGWSGFWAAVPLMVTLFLGIETATEVGSEIKKPKTTIPLGMALAIGLSALLYGLVAFSAVGVLGGAAVSSTNAPLLVLAERLLGPWGQAGIVFTATLSIGSSINAIFLVFTRYLLAMARANMLPTPLGLIDPASGSPINAQWLVLGICILGLLLPNDLAFLFIAVSIPSLLQYGAICYAATVLVRRYPDRYQGASFRLPKPVLFVLSGLGIVLMTMILVLGLGTDVRPYGLLLIWGLVGIGYYGHRRQIIKHG